MNRIFIITIALLFSFIGPKLGQAGDCVGLTSGKDAVDDFTSGIPFIYEKANVINVAGCKWMEIETSDGENIFIYGAGSTSYWKAAEMERPKIGETIKVRGFITVDDDWEERHFITSIQAAGQEEALQLRDPDTGSLLWSHARGCKANKPSSSSGIIVAEMPKAACRK